MKLADACLKIGSGATPSGGKNSYCSSGVSLIRSQNVHDLSFSHEGLVHINDEQAEKLRNVTVTVDDVLLNITGDSVARTCIVDESVLPARVNQHVAIIRVDKSVTNPYYIMLWLVWQKNRLLTLAANGATRNALTKEIIQSLDVALPDLSIQACVARLLSSLDRKIALNRRKIATLEKMAKEIYDYWFVQYDFPDKNGRPYKSSGGEMVYSPELKREIPKGWRVGALGDVAKYSDDCLKSNEVELSDYITTDCLRQGKQGREMASNLPPVVANLVGYQCGDTLVANIRPYLKKIWFATSSGGSSQDVLVFRPINESSAQYVYSIIRQDHFFDYVMAAAKGSKMPRGDKNHIMRYPLVVATPQIVQIYERYVSPLRRMMGVCQRQVSQLSVLRDFVLPLLMNGQVKLR